MSITIENLTKNYGEQKAVNNISFAMKKGEIVGFLGPNGAGKSTTMKMITGYLQPSDGKIEVAGIDVEKQPLEVKKKIGYLPESNALYFDMYVREYLSFIASVHGLDDKKKRVDDVIGLTGLTPESNKRIGQLSKGYKQRVGLAAALIHQPEVLILDEPTSGLDPNQIIEIRNVIKGQGQDKSVLFSSHILQEVEAICDRVIIINKGNIVADDSLKNLQNEARGNFVSVSFGKQVDQNLFSGLSSVTEVVEKDGYTYQLASNNAELTRKQLVELSLRENLNIVSLQSENKSLEDVFRRLTTSTSENK